MAEYALRTCGLSVAQQAPTLDKLESNVHAVSIEFGNFIEILSAMKRCVLGKS